MNQLIKRVLAWLDNNILFLGSAFLLLFIPLWPKIPLADILPGYIVRMRLEDIIVGILFIIYVIWHLRHKVSFKDLPGWQLVFGYLAVGAMAVISGVLLLQTIPFTFPDEIVHIGKSLLHWGRYVEYFFLAFLAVSGFRTRRQVQVALGLIVLVTLLLSIYSIGQKYFYWPVYSTMNREFSKGVRLYIDPTSHARVQATFGGHYDFGAYLVMVLPFSLQLLILARRWWQKIGLALIHFLGVWSLIVCASRSSLLAYFAIAGLLITVNVFVPRAKSIWRKLGKFFSWQILYYAVIAVLMFGWGQDAIQRFVTALDKTEPFHTMIHTTNDWRKQAGRLLGLIEVAPPSGGVSLAENDLGVLTPTDTQPTSNRPGDVYVDVPASEITVIDASGTATVVREERTWSENADKYGLAIAIRYDTLWPNARRGFWRNPLLGSGYATLVKGENIDQFTEADSTDNNFLRVLGETGALGFLTFFGIIEVALYYAYRHFRPKSDLEKAVLWSFALAIIGILINAIMIDVFAASKVAFSFWLFVGLFYATIKVSAKPEASLRRPLPVSKPTARHTTSRRRRARRHG